MASEVARGVGASAVPPGSELPCPELPVKAEPAHPRLSCGLCGRALPSPNPLPQPPGPHSRVQVVFLLV